MKYHPWVDVYSACLELQLVYLYEDIHLWSSHRTNSCFCFVFYFIYIFRTAFKQSADFTEPCMHICGE